MFLLKSPSLIGLDIQEDEITLLQVKKHKQYPCIEGISAIALPNGVIKEGKILMFEQLVASLSQLRKQAQVTGKNTAIALPQYCVLSKQIQLSRMPEQEIEIEIQTRLPEYFPGITEEVCFDYIFQRDDILLVAAKYHVLKEYVDAVTQAGFRVKIVDVAEYALMRALNYYVALKNKTLGLLIVKLDCVQCIVFQDESIVFSQSFPCVIANDCLQELLQRIYPVLALMGHQVSEWFLSGKKIFLEKIHPLPNTKIIEATFNSLTSFGLAIRSYQYGGY